MSEQALQPLQLKDLNFDDIEFKGFVLPVKNQIKQYSVSITQNLSRLFSTHLGERVMLPEFGTRLYELRDRDFNSHWRILATRYIFEAVSKWEPRVKFKQLHFNIDGLTGKHNFYLELDNA